MYFLFTLLLCSRKLLGMVLDVNDPLYEQAIGILTLFNLQNMSIEEFLIEPLDLLLNGEDDNVAENEKENYIDTYSNESEFDHELHRRQCFRKH